MNSQTLLIVSLAVVAAVILTVAVMRWYARQAPGAVETELFKLADEAITKIADTTDLQKIMNATASQIQARQVWLSNMSARLTAPAPAPMASAAPAPVAAANVPAAAPAPAQV